MSVSSVMKRTVCVLCAAVTGLCASSCALDSTEVQHIPIVMPTRLTVSWWGNELRSDYTIKGIKEYEQRKSDIDIIPCSNDFSGYKETLDSLMRCRKEADILMINSAWLPEYSPDGEGFLDLNEYSNLISLSNFDEKELSYGTMNGKLNALPIALNSVTFYFNKQMLDSYDLTVPQTWDDLFSCAEVLSKDGIYTIESSYKHYWKMLIAREEQLTGKEVFGDRNYFTEENVVSMFEFFKRLQDEKVIPEEEYAKPDFLEGKTAGAALWVSEAEYYVTPLEKSGGVVSIGEYLTEPGAKRFGWYVKPTSLLAVSKNSEHPEDAVKLLDYLMNDSRMAELQGTEKGIPLSRSALETLESKGLLTGLTYEAATALNDKADMFDLMPPLLEDNARVNKFFEYYELYYYERMSVKDAARAFVTQYPFSPPLRG